MYDSFKTKKTLKIGKKTYTYYSLKYAEKNGLKNVSALPYSIKILLENLIRHEDEKTVLKSDILEFQKWKKQKNSSSVAIYIMSLYTSWERSQQCRSFVHILLQRITREGESKHFYSKKETPS